MKQKKQPDTFTTSAQVKAIKKYREKKCSLQMWTTPEQYKTFKSAYEKYQQQNNSKISYAAFITALCETYLNQNHE